MSVLLANVSKKQALIYAGFLVAYEFLTYIANDMAMPAMIKVVATFKAPETAIADSLTTYLLGGASLQIILGPLSDRYGRRPVMLFGVLSFFLFTIAIACSQSINQYLIMRFFEGMGLCFIAVVGYSTLQEIFSEIDAIRLMAIMANIAIIAPLIGPLVGAGFVSFFSWRYIFVIIAILSLITFIGLYYFMPESVGQKQTDGTMIKRMELSIYSIYKNYRKLIFNSVFVFGSFALGIIYLPLIAWIGLSPTILIGKSGLSMLHYGLLQLPVFGAYIWGVVVLQRIVVYRTIKQMILLGSALTIPNIFLIYLFPLIINFNYTWLMPGLIGYFFGLGILVAPLTRLILFSTRVTKGTASALMNFIGMTIQAFGVEIANLIYQSHNNSYFALFCVFSGILYSVVIIFCFSANKKRLALSTPG